MPKYYEFKIAGYYLYFTSYCVIECMHVHASDRRLTEAGSAKFFVRDNGDTVLQERGILPVFRSGTTAIWSSLQNTATTRTPRKNISTLSLS